MAEDKLAPFLDALRTHYYANHPDAPAHLEEVLFSSKPGRGAVVMLNE